MKKCFLVPEEQVPLEDLVMGEDLTYQHPIKILETSERVSWGTRPLRCARFNGATTQKKLHGNGKKNLRQNSQTSSQNRSNPRDEIPFKRVGLPRPEFKNLGKF
jgi:hypothetical protein